MDKEFEYKLSFATCQERKSSCSVVVMVAAGGLLLAADDLLPFYLPIACLNELLFWDVWLISPIFNRRYKRGWNNRFSSFSGCLPLVQFIIKAASTFKQQLYMQLFCTAPSHVLTAFSNTGKEPHSHTPIKIGYVRQSWFSEFYCPQSFSGGGLYFNGSL